MFFYKGIFRVLLGVLGNMCWVTFGVFMVYVGHFRCTLDTLLGVLCDYVGCT